MSAEENAEPTIRYWHGGAPGRKVGDELLPPSRSKFAVTNKVLTGFAGRDRERAYRDDRVYATSDRKLAEVFAILYTQDRKRQGIGHVYEVELENPEPDKDFLRTEFVHSYEARRGVIVGAGVPCLIGTRESDEYLDALQCAGREITENADREAALEKERKRSARDSSRTHEREPDSSGDAEL